MAIVIIFLNSITAFWRHFPFLYSDTVCSRYAHEVTWYKSLWSLVIRGVHIVQNNQISLRNELRSFFFFQWFSYNHRTYTTLTIVTRDWNIDCIQINHAVNVHSCPLLIMPHVVTFTEYLLYSSWWTHAVSIIFNTTLKIL